MTVKSEVAFTFPFAPYVAYIASIAQHGLHPISKGRRMKQDDRKVVCNPLLVYPVVLCFTHQKGFVAASQTVSRATELKLFTLSSVVLEICLHIP